MQALDLRWRLLRERAGLTAFLGTALCSLAAAQGPFIDCTRVLRVETGTQPRDDFGWERALVDDIDGDGIDEVAVGMAGIRVIDSDPGHVLLLDGRTGVERLRIDGTALYERLGWHVANAGDVDGDGASDLIAVARDVVRLYSSATGALRLEIPQTGLAPAIVGLGDVDGDGVPDFAATSFAEWNPGDDHPRGRVLVYSGASGGVIWTRAGRFPEEQFGFSLATPGDVNDDGRADLAVFARRAPSVTGNFSAGRLDVYDVVADALVYEVVGQDGAPINQVFQIGNTDRGTASQAPTPDFLLVGGAFEPPDFLPYASARIIEGRTGVERWRLISQFGEGFFDAGRVGDIDGDGIDEFALERRSGGGAAPVEYALTIYSGTGAPLRHLRAASDGLFGRVPLARGDIDGDGVPDFDVIEYSWFAPTRVLVISGVPPVRSFGLSLAGSARVHPQIALGGCPQIGGSIRVELSNVRGGAFGSLLLGRSRADRPFRGGIVYPAQVFHTVPHRVGGATGVAGAGGAAIALPVPPDPGLVGHDFFAQAIYRDAGAAQGFSMTRGLQLVVY